MPNTRLVHFSIDDISRSWRYISNTRPASIFDLRLYGTLKRWHELYDLKVSLYCISEFEGFDIQRIPECYGIELNQNKDWLRYGFHSRTEISFAQDVDYKNGFINVIGKLKQLNAGITNNIRVHSWLTTNEQKKWLVSQGIQTLFYPNDEKYQYNENGFFYDEGLKHQVTKCWVEKMEKISEETAHIGDSYISFFTHEWCFDEQLEKIENLIKLYYMSDYIFV